MTMTQAEQDRDLTDARAYLSATKLTADRCRHASVTETSLWFFLPGADKKAKPIQIGSASRLPPERDNRLRTCRWEVTRMFNGQPVARCYAGSLLEAVTYIVRFEHGRYANTRQAMEA